MPASIDCRDHLDHLADGATADVSAGDKFEDRAQHGVAIDVSLDLLVECQDAEGICGGVHAGEGAGRRCRRPLSRHEVTLTAKERGQNIPYVRVGVILKGSDQLTWHRVSVVR